MNGLHMLYRIREFVNKNPKKQFWVMGAGETKQLPPTDDLTSTRKPDEYADEWKIKIKYIYLPCLRD